MAFHSYIEHEDHHHHGHDHECHEHGHGEGAAPQEHHHHEGECCCSHAGHHHGHHHGYADVTGTKLLWTSLLNITFTIIEVVGGIISNSLSLLSDALHNLADSSAIFLAYIAHLVSKRKPDVRKTFGYKRFDHSGLHQCGTPHRYLSLPLCVGLPTVYEPRAD